MATRDGAARGMRKGARWIARGEGSGAPGQRRGAGDGQQALPTAAEAGTARADTAKTNAAKTNAAEANAAEANAAEARADKARVSRAHADGTHADGTHADGTHADETPARRPGAPSRTVRAALAVLRFARTLGRAFAAAWDMDATERAAALTYYAALALFPALLMTFALIGLAGGPSDNSLSAEVTTLLPAQSRATVAGALDQMAEDHSATLSLAALSGFGAAWSACSYAAVFRRALHHIHGADDHRPAWRTAPRILLTSLTLLFLLVCAAVLLIVSGELSRRAGEVLHLGGPFVSAWRSLRWPMLLVVAGVLVLLLFRSGPRGTRSLRTMAPGGAVAVGLWLLASAGFAVYAARMGTYHRLYGPLGGTVAFLVWLWLSNLALMIGAHFNAEHARAPGRHGKAAPVKAAPVKAAPAKAAPAHPVDPAKAAPAG